MEIGPFLIGEEQVWLPDGVKHGGVEVEGVVGVLTVSQAGVIPLLPQEDVHPVVLGQRALHQLGAPHGAPGRSRRRWRRRWKGVSWSRLRPAGVARLTLTMHRAGAAQELSHAVGSQGKLKSQSHSSREEKEEQ